MKKIVAIMAVILLMSAPVLAQEIDYCEGDFDCDGDCDGGDAWVFKSDFGRSSLQNPCPDCIIDIPKTGQTVSYATGDDGDLEKGVAWPNPRFTDNLDGTITDNLTGLIWLKDADCFLERTWNDALSDANGLADRQCGLTDGSNAGDWRLPNYKELFTLVDVQKLAPAVPSGHPFTNVRFGFYWSSTTLVNFSLNAWGVYMFNGDVDTNDKSAGLHVWPVRDAQ